MGALAGYASGSVQNSIWNLAMSSEINPHEKDYRAILARLKQKRDSAFPYIARDRRFKRLYRKMWQLVSGDVALRDILRYLLLRVWSVTRGCFFSAYNAAFRAWSGNKEHVKEDSDYIAVMVTGGIGDVVVCARWIRDIGARWPSIRFHIYYSNPDAIRFIFSTNLSVEDILWDRYLRDEDSVYSLILVVNQFVHVKSVQQKTIGEAVANLINERSIPYERFRVLHPILDGLFADAVTASGYTRETFLHSLVGIDYGGPILSLASESIELEPLMLSPKMFITVHDGWDSSFALISNRPTKAYPVEQWNQVISIIRARRPDVPIVQLGGEKGAALDGVSLNLKGRLTMAQSVSFLEKSFLHIDTESGLVHLAASVGTKSIVIFGPTNASFFSYRSNINIVSDLCHNCWWSTDTWMDLCPVGLDTPACMRAIAPQVVADQALLELMGMTPNTRVGTCKDRRDVGRGC